MRPVTGYPRADVVAEIEQVWRDRYGGQSEEAMRKILDFEMQSVELHRENLVPLLRGHGVSEGDKLLDFGSGPGCSATAISYDLGAHVTVVEPSTKIKDIAALWPRAYGVDDKPDFHFITDTLNLPFEPETFDYVLTSSSLEDMKGDRGRYIRDMTRVRKPVAASAKEPRKHLFLLEQFQRPNWEGQSQGQIPSLLLTCSSVQNV